MSRKIIEQMFEFSLFVFQNYPDNVLQIDDAANKMKLKLGRVLHAWVQYSMVFEWENFLALYIRYMYLTVTVRLAQSDSLSVKGGRERRVWLCETKS